MEQTKIEVTMWPVEHLVEHPDNPRTVRTNSEKFQSLRDSVKANGVVEPLIVRQAPLEVGPIWRQVLSGHRRLRAAQLEGLAEVPVIDRGELPDDLAFDLVALGNEHEDLTPIEEGRRVATWLDKYGQDVAAVAAKLGKPPHWVVQHAEIARGLSADWVAAAEGRTEAKYLGGDGNPFDRWTAAHWCVIARLPAGLQASELAKFLSGRYCSYDRWTVKELQSRIKIDLLYLVKAPFEAATCAGCVNRTDRQPLLWGEAAEEAIGDKARCLDRKCWEKKAVAYAKREFKAAAQAQGVPAAIPVSLLEPPGNDYRKREAYQDRVRELKKHYGAKLLTADRVEVVPEGTKGAVAAIAVAGVRGKGSMGVKWVKIRKEPAAGGGGRPGNFETPRMKKERVERDRWEKATKEAGAKLLEVDMEKLPGGAKRRLATVLVAVRMLEACRDKELADLLRTWRNSDKEFAFGLLERLATKDLVDRFKSWTKWGSAYDKDLCLAVGELFGVDVQAIYDAIVAAENPPAVNEVADVNVDNKVNVTGKPRTPRASGSARRKKAKAKRLEDPIDHIDPVDGGEEEGGSE